MMKHEQEVYAKSFPSTWLSATNAPPSPAENKPSTESRSQHSARSSLSEFKSDTNSNNASDSWEDSTVEERTSSDAAFDGVVQHVNESSVPTTARHERRRAIAKTLGARLTVYKSRRPNPGARAVSAPATEYSTVYPASWTITRDVPQPRSAAVCPTHEPSLKPGTIAMTATADAGSIRTISTLGQGDVGPASPMRRRLQRNFQSMSHPSPPPTKLDARAMSVVVSKLEQMRRLMAYPQRPAQNVPYTRLETPERHESSNSGYSAIERAPTSSGDAPANHRMASIAYSQYGSDGWEN